jgi:hypothetical protein
MLELAQNNKLNLSDDVETLSFITTGYEMSFWCPAATNA